MRASATKTTREARENEDVIADAGSTAAAASGAPQQAQAAQRPLDSALPPGWSYNPSARSQRVPIIAIAILNACVAGYLAVCQIAFHGRAWDPFFGVGTQLVLTSAVSRAFPVSDAALGAGAYLLEALCGFMGDERRWRSKPWLVLTFGLLVLPLFFVTIDLMILQPVAVHAWCSLCLLCAAGMLVMVPLALDEVIAAVQFLQHAARQKLPMWHTFWHGGEMKGTLQGQERQRLERTEPRADGRSGRTPSFTGYTPTWTLLICLAVGIVMLFMPTLLSDVNEGADSLYTFGAFVITISSLAFAEVARPARFLLMGCAAWLITVSPFSMQGATNNTKVLEVLLALVLFACCYPRGTIRQRYDGWDSYLR